MLAAIRPGGQDFPVLLHLVGATIAFGALLASASALALARGEIRMYRIGYFSLLLVALPGWALMWGAGEWIYRKQGWNDLPGKLGDPDWLRIGFGVANWGGLLFLGSLAIGGIALARLRVGKSGAGLLKVTMVIALVLAVFYAVAVWAMTGKPTGGTGGSATPALAPGASSAVTTDVSVSATEFRFTLTKQSVPAGKVVFKITNNGKITHDFSIDGETSADIAPGQSTTLTVTLGDGQLPYLCTIPGHAAAGMKGTLTVT